MLIYQTLKYKPFMRLFRTLHHPWDGDSTAADSFNGASHLPDTSHPPSHLPDASATSAYEFDEPQAKKFAFFCIFNKVVFCAAEKITSV